MSKFPNHSYINIETYYQDKLVSKEYFDSNPEIFKDYPTQEQVMNIKEQIEYNKHPEVFYTIIISEFGVSIKESKDVNI